METIHQEETETEQTRIQTDLDLEQPQPQQQPQQQPQVPIFRFKLSQTILNDIVEFSKQHRYDDRKTFKEEWNKWCKENEHTIQQETDRLRSLGYDGNVKQKLFVAVRYYFRTKEYDNDDNNNAEDNNKKEVKQQQQRKPYVSMDSKMIELIDNHLKEYAQHYDVFTPSNAYDDFCSKYTNEMFQEITRLCKVYKQQLQLDMRFTRDKDSDRKVPNDNDEEENKKVIYNKLKIEIPLKFKKTYKNRYFIFTRSNQLRVQDEQE
jgi:hypothetical protein